MRMKSIPTLFDAMFTDCRILNMDMIPLVMDERVRACEREQVSRQERRFQQRPNLF